MAVDMPDIKGVEWVADLLHDIGYADATAGGLKAVAMSDLASLSDVLGVRLPTWVILLLRRLSAAYAGQASASTAKDAPAPYAMKITDEDMAKRRQTVDAKLRGLF